jgi:ankyrin repeat protein
MATDSSHFTPLHWAAWSGSAGTVKLLLDKGADPFYVDDSNYTALHWAQYWGHKDVAKLLKDKMDSMPRPAKTEKK